MVIIQKIKCPNHKCGRRIFDIGITRFRIIVELKCPHCGEVVRVYWKPKEKKIYIDKKNGGRISCCFCFYGLKRSFYGHTYAINGKKWKFHCTQN